MTIHRRPEKTHGDLNVAEASNIQNEIRIQDENEVNDLRKNSENETISNIVADIEIILGEIKRRFASDRWYVNPDIPICQR